MALNRSFIAWFTHNNTLEYFADDDSNWNDDFGIIYIDRAEFLLMPKFGQQTLEWNILLVITGKNAIFHNLALFFIGF